MTNEEVNTAVARKLGWVQCCNPMTMENGKIVDCFGWSKGGSHFHEAYPDYCTSIEAAWEICEKIKNTTLVEILWHDGEWECQIASSEVTTVNAKADTAPHAICLAFLKLP